MRYEPLVTDLDNMIELFETTLNKLKSDWQKITYPQPEGKGKILRHEQFAGLGKVPKDFGRPTLMLAKEDGYGDGISVGSKGYRTARAYWYSSDGHSIPPAEDCIRMGFFFRLPVYYTLLFGIRALWEKYLAKRRGFRKDQGDSFTKYIPGEFPTDEEINGFDPDYEPLCDLLEEIAGKVKDVVTNSLSVSEEKEKLNNLGYFVYDSKKLKILAKEMLLHKLYLQSLMSKKQQDFFELKRKEYKTLIEGDEKQQQEFWLQKMSWLEIAESLGEQLLEREDFRFNNMRVVMNYLKIFPKSVELEELLLATRMVERRILLMELNPAMSAGELEKAVGEEEEKEKLKINQLKDDAATAPFMDRIKGGVPIDKDKMYELHQDAKKVMKKIYRLLHPDILENNPAFKKLTNSQKEKLKELWNTCLEIRKKELDYSEGSLGSMMRVVSELKDNLSLAEMILMAAGVEIDTAHMIQGDTIPGMLTWLKEDIKKMEKALFECKQDIIKMREDKDILEKIAILDSPRIHKKIQADIEQQIIALKEKLPGLKEKLQSFFSREEAAC